MEFKIGISTCPNDTFIFGALLEKQIKSIHSFDLFLDDIEVLNNKALNNELDIVKVSYGLIPQVLDKYYVLKAGGALGFGCGPLVVASSKIELSKSSGKKIAIPGYHTSAFRFFKHFYSEDFDFVEMRFDKIMPAVKDGSVLAGVVIHEGRFVYKAEGLTKVVDLGELWEEKYKSPIPLGAILIKKELVDFSEEITNLIRESIKFAETDYEKIKPFIKFHAQELDDKVIKSHIELYVNKFSYDMTPAIKTVSNFLGCPENIFK